MKRPLRLWRLAAFLFALLALATASFYFGKAQTAINPESTSYEASGTKAFATLLQRSGFEVSRTNFLPLHPLPDTLLIAFCPTGIIPFQTPEEVKKDESPVYGLAEEQLQAGYPVMLLMLRDSSDAISDPNFRQVQGPSPSGNTSYQLAMSKEEPGAWRWPYSLPTKAVFDNVSGGAGILSLFTAETKRNSTKSGIGAILGAGSIALNENIDKAQNADYLMMVVRLLAAKKINKVTMLDGSFSGPSEPSLLDILGPWSQAAWTQLLLVLLVVAWGVAARFGLPLVSRERERSSRQLLDGIADTMHRGRHAQWALNDIIADADRKIRNRLGLTKTHSVQDRNSRLSAELVMALEMAEQRAPMADEAEAVRLAGRLDVALSSWLAADRPNAGTRGRS